MKRVILLAGLLGLATVAALLHGQLDVGPSLLWQGLVTGEGPGALILDTIRGPRVATALGAGAVLGLSGTIFQTLFRNPLAAPDLLGFNAGAGLAIIAGIAFGIALPAPVLAAAGGLVVAVLVGLLAYRRGHGTPALSTSTDIPSRLIRSSALISRCSGREGATPTPQFPSTTVVTPCSAEDASTGSQQICAS